MKSQTSPLPSWGDTGNPQYTGSQESARALCSGQFCRLSWTLQQSPHAMAEGKDRNSVGRFIASPGRWVEQHRRRSSPGAHCSGLCGAFASRVPPPQSMLGGCRLMPSPRKYPRDFKDGMAETENFRRSKDSCFTATL